MRILLILIYCLPLLVPDLLAQGPLSGFMPRKKQTDIALTYSYDHYDFYYFGSEKRPLKNTTQSVNLFIERGFTDSFSLVFTLPYIWIDEMNTNFQDATIFIKYRNHYNRFGNGDLSLITGVGLSFPVSNYSKETETPIGERSTLFQGRLLMQIKFDIGLFLHLQSGVNFRIIPDAQTSIPLLFRTGFGGSKFYVDAWVEFFNTINPGTDLMVFGGAGSSWIKIGGTIYYPLIPQIGLAISGSALLVGQNIGLSNRVNAGVVFRFGGNG